MKNFISVTALVAVICLSDKLLAQQLTFADTFQWHVNGDNRFGNFIELSDSSYMLTALTAPTLGTNGIEWLFIHIGVDGSILNTNNLGVFSNYLGKIQKTDSTLIVSGSLNSWFQSNQSICITEVNLLGDTLWVKYFGPTFLQCSAAPGYMKNDFDNNYLIGSNDACGYGLLKLDSFFNELWHTGFFMSGGLYDLQIDPFDGSYLLCGGQGQFSIPYVVERLDNNGNSNQAGYWIRSYGSNPNYIQGFAANHICFLADSNYLVSCFGDDWQLMKLNRYTGDTMWTRSYADSAQGITCRLKTMTEAGNNQFLCVSEDSYFLIDEIGDSIWSRQLPFGPNNQVWQVEKTHDGGFAFSGSIYRFNPHRRIACFFKTDSLGNVNIASQFDPVQNIGSYFYPNPASTELFITSTNLQMKQRFTLYSHQGIPVMQSEITDNNFNSGINITHLPNGLYIAELRNAKGDKVVRQKLVVQH